MPGSAQDPGISFKGAYLCSEYELRITARCLIEDLGESDDCVFDELCDRHEIVRSFRDRRTVHPDSGDTVGPEAGDRTLYTLRYGSDHRGATWYDESNQVVWLTAAHSGHRSGQSDDSFPYFTNLREEGRMYPKKLDYARLDDDQAARFSVDANRRVPDLVAAARDDPGEEKTAELGKEPVSCVVVYMEELRQVFVAMSGKLALPLMQQVLNLVSPGTTFEQWEWTEELPTRALVRARGEVCCSTLLE